MTQPAPRARSGRGLLIAALLAFVLGGGLALWLAQTGKLDFAIPGTSVAVRPDVRPDRVATPLPGASPPAVPDDLPAADQASAQASVAVGGIETRLALLEERLARIDLQTDAASGNAARAEALLVALATRRTIAKGAPLGYLENQLTLRFAGAQPDAVKTLTKFARSPVTLDQLTGGLDALAPAPGAAPADESVWARIKREFGGLLVVRNSSTPTQSFDDRVARTKAMLSAGRVEAAIAEVSRLPDADATRGWLDNARRYEAAQQALDVIETSAMLEPHGLHDASGNRVDEPSALTQPAPSPTPQPSATSTLM